MLSVVWTRIWSWLKRLDRTAAVDGDAVQAAEHQAAKRRLLDQARRRRSEHGYDGRAR